MGKAVDDLLFAGISFHDPGFKACLYSNNQKILPGLRNRINYTLCLSLEYDGKDDLSRFYFVDDIGVLEIGVTAVDVFDALTDFQFGGEDKNGKIQLESKAGFDAEIGAGEFDEIFCFAGRGVGGEIIAVIDTPHHVDAKIADAIGQEFQLGREAEQQGLDLLGRHDLFAGGRVLDMV